MGICISFGEVDWELTKDVLGAASSIATVVGVVVAIIFGWLGLYAWRKQLRGGLDHSLGLKMLVALYRFRDELRLARRPMFYTPDIPKSLLLRHENVALKKVDIEVLLHECDAFWGEEFSRKVNVLFKLYEELLADVEYYVYASDPSVTLDNMDIYKMFHGERTRVMLEDGSAQSDNFNVRFEAALQDAENYLKVKVAR